MSESKHSKAGLPSPSKIAGQWLMLSGLSSPHIFHKVQIISPQPCKTKCTCGSALDRSESRCAAYSLWFFQSRDPFPVIWKCWNLQPPVFKASFSQIPLHCQVPGIDSNNNCICHRHIQPRSKLIVVLISFQEWTTDIYCAFLYHKVVRNEMTQCTQRYWHTLVMGIFFPNTPR